MTLRKTLLLLLGALMTVSLFQFAAIAQNEDEAGDMPQVVKDDADRTKLRDTLAERLADYKENHEDAISDAREKIITRKCEAAQSKVMAFQTRVEAAKTRRETVYTNIMSKLSDIATRLGNNEVDVMELNSLLTTANEMYSQLAADFDSFITILGDIVDIDCVDDPGGFQAALEAARSNAADLKTEVQTFHTYLKEDVKTAFRNVIAELVNDSEEEN